MNTITRCDICVIHRSTLFPHKHECDRTRMWIIFLMRRAPFHIINELSNDSTVGRASADTTIRMLRPPRLFVEQFSV